MNIFYKILFALGILFYSADLNFAQDMDFFEPKTSLGGYGELHYNYDKPDEGNSTEVLDFHRFILFIGHSFSEKWSFKSELELEHNFVSEGQGELELEQAYVNYHHSDYFGFNAGVVLPSVGLINEYHEPPLFFGVERPDYARNIIPTTWFGNGAAIYGNLKGLSYKFTVMEGLDADGFSASSGIRGGRQKGFEANAENFLYNFRLDYLNVPGFKFGASYTYNNAKGDSTTNKINFIEFHAQFQSNGIYAVTEFGNINYGSGNIETSRGFYFDLGYDLSTLLNIQTKIIPFVRYSDYNTAYKTISGGDSEKANHYTQIMGGLSIKPLDNVVFKFDYGTKERELGNQKSTLFNLGVGYMF